MTMTETEALEPVARRILKKLQSETESVTILDQEALEAALSALSAAPQPPASGVGEPVAWLHKGSGDVIGQDPGGPRDGSWVPLVPASTLSAVVAERDRLARELEKAREAARHIVPYLRYTIGDESPGHHPTMPSAVAAFETAFGMAGPLRSLTPTGGGE